MQTTNHAKDFFIKYVAPSFAEWSNSRNDQRVAMDLANNLNNIIEYYWHTFSDTNPDKVFNKTKLKSFRNELAQNNQDISLIRDIADAHKHLRLSRPDRNLTNANQTAPKNLGYGQAYGLAYGGGEVLAITLDDGSEKYFSIIAEAAYKYWANEFE